MVQVLIQTEQKFVLSAMGVEGLRSEMAIPSVRYRNTYSS